MILIFKTIKVLVSITNKVKSTKNISNLLKIARDKLLKYAGYKLFRKIP